MATAPEAKRLIVVMPSGQCRGGAEEALLHLAAHGREADLSLHIVVLEEGELPARLKAAGVDVTLLPVGRLREVGRYGRALLRLRRILLEEKPVAILGWMTKAHLYGGVAALGTNIPAIYFQMGLPDGGRVDRFSRLLPAAGALACSEFAAAAQRPLVRYPVVAVPLAADHDRFASVHSVSPAALRAKLGLPSNGPLVGIVGRLQRWKGMHVFAEAMEAVTAKVSNCHGVIVGGAHDLEPEYAQWLKDRVANKVQMVGAQTNVPEWMQACDIVIHASEREPFGIVVVEAMALGKPVVATIPGGPAEIITDGRDGLLVPYGDAQALSAAILRFLHDPVLAGCCGNAAARRALDFTPEKFAAGVGSAVAALTASRNT